jgi:alpha-L-fucosidase 2
MFTAAKTLNKTLIPALCLALLPEIAPAEHLLWYRQPATEWNEALPVGNGRLGAMVFGGVVKERIQLNEDTVWAGEKRGRNNPQGAAAIPRIRKLLVEGHAAEAQDLAETSVVSTPSGCLPTSRSVT